MTGTEAETVREFWACSSCGATKPLHQFPSKHCNNLIHGKYRRCRECIKNNVPMHSYRNGSRAAFTSTDECPPLPAVGDIRHCPGYPGLAADSDGNIWSCRNRNGWRIGYWRIVETVPFQDGYNRVGHCGKNLRSAHLIIESFHGPRQDGMFVCHRDGNNGNDKAENLYWGTQSQNELDKRRHGTSATGERNPSAKLTEADALKVKRLRKQGLSRSEIRTKTKIAISTIDNIIYGRNWTYIEA